MQKTSSSFLPLLAFAVFVGYYPVMTIYTTLTENDFIDAQITKIENCEKHRVLCDVSVSFVYNGEDYNMTDEKRVVYNFQENETHKLMIYDGTPKYHMFVRDLFPAGQEEIVQIMLSRGVLTLLLSIVSLVFFILAIRSLIRTHEDNREEKAIR